MKVVIAHPQPVVRHGLRGMLEMHPACVVVGEAASATDTLALAERHTPDVLVLGLDGTGLDGVEVARAVKRAAPSCGLVGIGTLTDPRRMVSALAAGMSAILPATVGSDELLPVCEAVHRGAYPINDVALGRQDVAHALLDTFRTHGDQLPVFSPLGRRELEVLELVAAGHTNKQIGAQLCVTERTVSWHVAGILRKLGVNDRAQAVLAAVRNGWITL